jgi:hypothetical protein
MGPIRVGRCRSARRPGDPGRVARGVLICGDGGLVKVNTMAESVEDLPDRATIVTRFNVAEGCCVRCGRRVQGRDAEQSSDAIGAAPGRPPGAGAGSVVAQVMRDAFAQHFSITLGSSPRSKDAAGAAPFSILG